MSGLALLLLLFLHLQGHTDRRGDAGLLGRGIVAAQRAFFVSRLKDSCG